MRIRRAVHRWAAVPVLFFVVGCEVDWTALEDGLVVAAVTLVLTRDPADSSWVGTDALAVLVRDSAEDSRVPGASVRISGESGKSLQLLEVPYGEATCQSDSTRDLSVGTCYKASTPSAYFAPGEELSLEIITPNGSKLKGASTIPRSFLPRGLSVRDGRCRLEPETSYRIEWRFAEGVWAHVMEAKFGGLPRSLWPHAVPLYLRTSWMAAFRGDDRVFPRALVEGGVQMNARRVARRLENGLPWGVTAETAAAAVDRNWANWIRPGRYNPNGEVRIPSVFGDGTGMFGTATRWTVTMESRDADDEAGLVDCGLQVAR